MGVESASYTLKPMLSPSDLEDFDLDYFIYSLRKQVPDAKHFIDEDGKPISAGSEWEFTEDMKAFSLKHPKVLIVIEAAVEYDMTYESRHYIKNGKAAVIEPVLTWPRFYEAMLA
ncbi:hypothetical protein MARCHEWKA_03410 [Brevundimonas phage vB_BpoS-Marchewka]|uniref:Uncharacterized protein n=1 Tax=Brevundimonas phage vB_BpoS-Marchewka TaxID=2948604 RepID=A0A9E7N312_9CAUD|nr:hypothetical protein MARCHEWKA_03410 [Brevundimonas phage vB_BpoS-Marchewka]UTC29299.1 hypothetical protein BAMBUS_02170 [Brevundimonas phage vB_BpoS-Bambus]